MKRVYLITVLTCLVVLAAFLGLFKVLNPHNTRENLKIGFIYDNNSHNSHKMFSHATNVDEIERLTGIDFFPAVDDKIENVVEAERGYF